MLFRIHSHQELFREWKDLERGTGKILLSSLVQNDMYLTHEQLNENFDKLHQQLVELQPNYSPHYFNSVTDLRDRTANYIKELNKTPITKEEFIEFRRQCPSYIAQYENGEDLFKNVEPVLTFCSHPSNPIPREGNCGMDVCPLLK